MSKSKHKHIDASNAGKVKASWSYSLEDPDVVAEKAKRQPKTSEFFILDFLQSAVLFYQLSNGYEKLFGRAFSYPQEAEEYNLKSSVDRALRIGKRYSIHNPHIIEEFVFCKKAYFNLITGLEFFEPWDLMMKEGVGERFVLDQSTELRDDYDSMKQLLLPTILDIFLHCGEVPIDHMYKYDSIFHDKTDEIVDYCYDQVANDKCGLQSDLMTATNIYRDELDLGKALHIGHYLIYVCEMVITGYSGFMQKDARVISSIVSTQEGNGSHDTKHQTDKGIRQNVFGAFQIALAEQTSLPIPEINSFEDLLRIRDDKRIKVFRKSMYEYLDAIERTDEELIIDIEKKVKGEYEKITGCGFKIKLNKRLSLILGALIGQVPILGNILSIMPWAGYELREHRKRHSFLLIGQS